MPQQDALLQRRRLRTELRRARNRAGLTQKQVAEAMDWSLSKLIRIEGGSVGISTSDLKGLLQHYGIDDQMEVDRIISMARSSKDNPPWWNAYRDMISDAYAKVLSYENAASVIHQYHPVLIPGLLQEEGYAREVITAYSGQITPEQIDNGVELRMQRQRELFDRTNPPELFFVLDEAALRRWVGGPDVMRRQLRHLQHVAASATNITIEVLRFESGAHAGMKGPFVIFEFPDYDDDVVYLETPGNALVVRDEEREIAAYRDTFARLRDLAGKSDLDTVVDRAVQEMSR